MGGERGFRKSLAELERESQVPREEQVELVNSPEAPPADPRGEEPDRDWFAAGG